MDDAPGDGAAPETPLKERVAEVLADAPLRDAILDEVLETLREDGTIPTDEVRAGRRERAGCAGALARGAEMLPAAPASLTLPRCPRALAPLPAPRTRDTAGSRARGTTAVTARRDARRRRRCREVRRVPWRGGGRAALRAQRRRVRCAPQSAREGCRRRRKTGGRGWGVWERLQ